jgi:hypothetical protein
MYSGIYLVEIVLTPIDILSVPNKRKKQVKEVKVKKITWIYLQLCIYSLLF